MTLDDWLDYIERLHSREIELGLARVAEVADRLALRRLPCPVIMVAGTNGKGSTCTLIERLGRASGLRTALYTSPHLFRFNERICLDGEPVSDALLCQAFADVEAARLTLPLTWFEFTTLVALRVFSQAGIDLAVLEIGLGGRLDAVNLLDADVAVVTSIGLDHQDWLGSDVEQIGGEKAAIARPGKPLVCGSADMPASVEQTAARCGATLLCAGADFTDAGAVLRWQDGSYPLPAKRLVPLGRDNLLTAIQALACLVPVSASAIDRVAGSAMAGRCQQLVLAGNDWFFDVGHNREALARLLASLPPPRGRRLVLFAMLADKPAQQVMTDFAATVDHWYLAGLSVSRGQSAASLAGLLPEQASHCCANTVAEALARLRADQAATDQVLVFGSFYTVAEAAAALSVDLWQAAAMSWSNDKRGTYGFE